METYGKGFARAYDQRWSAFAAQVAPLVHAYYEKAHLSGSKSLLDLCCGTGQLGAFFLEKGYRVLGIDRSEHMLSYARNHAAHCAAGGNAQFMRGDASDFKVEDAFGLAVSTYDSLNHLPDERSLEACFHCVLKVCEGIFIFDLNTRHGLRRWNGFSLDDSDDELLVVTRGVYDGEGPRAWTRITGFARTPDGTFERFDETIFNSVFKLERVREMLLDVGWRNAHIAAIADLQSPVSDPESLERAFFVARAR